MSLFEYKALTPKGKQKKGNISADSAKHARKLLREQGIVPIEVNSLQRSLNNNSKDFKNIDKKIKSSDLSLFTREMAALLCAGLELEDSLRTVAKQTENVKFRQILLTIHNKVLEGFSFASGLNDYPKAFPPIFRSTVQAGEEAGFLGSVLLHLAEYQEKQQLMKQKITQALIYPVILTLISLSIVSFLLVYVTPKILDIFTEEGHNLPLLTEMLVYISNFAESYGFYLLIGAVLLYFCTSRLLRLQKYQQKFHRGLLKLPLLGKTIRLINTARFLRALGILVKSHVPILQSFAVANELVSNLPIKNSIHHARDRVKEGASIHGALKNTGFFTPSSIQFISSGEVSGKLSQMLIVAADNQDRTVQFTLDTMLALFEPLLILLMGFIVMFIVLAILLPMFQISSLIG